MTMTNAEWMIKQGNDFTRLHFYHSDTCHNYKIFLDDTCIAVMSDDDICHQPVLSWLDMEHVEPILDDAEKRYLSAVIRPFRNDVLYIIKFGHFTGDEEIIVSCNYNKLNSVFSFDLPPFEKGTMYKGMEPNQKYTLGELGL